MQFKQGQDPGFQSYQRGQDPSFNAFQRGQGPAFERAAAGDFDFNYQQSPGYQQALDQGLAAVEGRHAAGGSRFSGGPTKDMIDYATGAAAQDYGNQFNRARGQFEADRGFGAQQAQAQNLFNQGQYQFGTNLGAQQSNLANQFNQGNFQFGVGAQQGANLQNYNMYNQQAMNQQGLDAGLADQGYAANQNLIDMYINQGGAMGNAALGLGNAQANSAMATRNTVNNALNTASQVGSVAAQFV